MEKSEKVWKTVMLIWKMQMFVILVISLHLLFFLHFMRLSICSLTRRILCLIWYLEILRFLARDSIHA